MKEIIKAAVDRGESGGVGGVQSGATFDFIQQ